MTTLRKHQFLFIDSCIAWAGAAYDYYPECQQEEAKLVAEVLRGLGYTVTMDQILGETWRLVITRP